MSWSQARWTALEADVEARRRRASEDHARALARRDAEIADATANSRVAAAAAAKAVNEAKAQLAERDAAVARLQAEAAQLAADLVAAQQQATEASRAAEANRKAAAAAEGSRAHIAGALRALTVQHERLVATGSRAAEELEQLNIGYGQLSEQVWEHLMQPMQDCADRQKHPRSGVLPLEAQLHGLFVHISLSPIQCHPECRWTTCRLISSAWKASVRR